MVGTSISHYKDTEKIGEGGMCVAYKAEAIPRGFSQADNGLLPHKDIALIIGNHTWFPKFLAFS